MKSQDVVILLKLISLQKREKGHLVPYGKVNWRGWLEEEIVSDDIRFNSDLYSHEDISELYTVRGLAKTTGIAKTQVSQSLNRSYSSGLAKRDRILGHPRANRKNFYEFIVYGLPYVFPAKAGPLARGIPTSFAAPVLNDVVLTAGELVPVWADANGSMKGGSVEPLFKTVPFAVKLDPELYALLALVDAIRIGMSRERKMAIDLLYEHFEL